jgi:hypothetical protein
MTARRWNCTPRPASRRCASQALATAALGTHDHSGRHTRHCSRLKQPCACNHGGRHARPLRPGQTTLLACRILASASVLTANARSERATAPRSRATRRTSDPHATAPTNESHAAARFSGSTTRPAPVPECLSCTRHRGGRHARPLWSAHTTLLAAQHVQSDISRGTAQPRLGPGPHAGQAIRTRQPRPTKTTPPRASPGPRHERPPRPSAFPARATAAVGTHDHSGRHTRHCSRLNTCDRASPATWVPPPCQEPNESRAARQPFRRPDRLPVVCAFEAAHAQNSHSLRAPLCA